MIKNLLELLWWGHEMSNVSCFRVQGKVSLISPNGIHQLHIFIFVLAVFHVIYSVATMALGRLKVSINQTSDVYCYSYSLTNSTLKNLPPWVSVCAYMHMGHNDLIRGKNNIHLLTLIDLVANTY